ncbi:hypothetical protein BaRGS_00022594 [Batillaria attramentaria]|uniref:Uncharacterized protein n=1 Tax=Batillaria attramentaria TaxID=370345 RepID=A0ABD0KFX1_9CAEN
MHTTVNQPVPNRHRNRKEEHVHPGGWRDPKRTHGTVAEVSRAESDTNLSGHLRVGDHGTVCDVVGLQVSEAGVGEVNSKILSVRTVSVVQLRLGCKERSHKFETRTSS